MIKWVNKKFEPKIYAKWWKWDTNWGDALNRFLIEKISGRNLHFTSNPFREKYLVVGSIMGLLDRNTIVWGAGFTHSKQILKKSPKRICAVRGPLTREILLAHGIDAPEIYGDPALLMPRFYNPVVDVRYEYGIVPHYVDKEHPWLARQGSIPNVLIIDVMSDTLSFVQQIKQCRYILSSSLHGIICADAYGIPAMWIEFSDKVFGDGFKYHDYLKSIHRTNYERIHVTESTTLDDIMAQYVSYTIEIDLDRLYVACPFRKDVADLFGMK